MEDTFTQWPYRWFGFWRDESPDYLKFPYITDFFGPQFDRVTAKKVAVYLVSCPCIVIVSLTASCLFHGCPFPVVDASGAPISVSWMTDGTWVWRVDLIHYVLRHNVRLPDSFLNHIKGNGFAYPRGAVTTVDKAFVQSLDLPYMLTPYAKILAE